MCLLLNYGPALTIRKYSLFQFSVWLTLFKQFSFQCQFQYDDT